MTLTCRKPRRWDRRGFQGCVVHADANSQPNKPLPLETQMLALESDPALIELLKVRLRALEFDVANVAHHADATGIYAVADKLSQILRDIFRIQAIPDALASRGRKGE